MRKIHIIWAIVAVIALIGGYFWGHAGAAAQKSASAAADAFSGSSTRRFGGAGGQLLAAGKIAEMDSSSITLQLPNGNSEVVFYSSSTQVTEPTTVPVSALSIGSDVAVGGTQNSDGSFTAAMIQVRPAGAGGNRNSGSGG